PKPLIPREDDTLFPNMNGKPIEPKSFAHWYRYLRALGIRVRGAYAMKDTFVSLALMTPNVNLQWLEEQTSVALPTLKAHYARFYPGVSRELARSDAHEKRGTQPRNHDGFRIVDECEEGDLNPQNGAGNPRRSCVGVALCGVALQRLAPWGPGGGQ